MPLDPSILQDAFGELFAEPPPTALECAAAWAAAAGDYAAGVVPPSTTVAAARAALEPALAAAFESPTAPADFDAAVAAFAATLGVGMLPAYTATPPPAPLGVLALLAAPSPSHAAAAAAWTAHLDAWFRTGIAVLVAPPNTAIPWS